MSGTPVSTATAAQGAGVGGLQHQQPAGFEEFPAVLDHGHGGMDMFQDIEADDGVVGRSAGFLVLEVSGGDVRRRVGRHRAAGNAG